MAGCGHITVHGLKNRKKINLHLNANFNYGFMCHEGRLLACTSCGVLDCSDVSEDSTASTVRLPEVGSGIQQQADQHSPEQISVSL